MCRWWLSIFPLYFFSGRASFHADSLSVTICVQVFIYTSTRALSRSESNLTHLITISAHGWAQVFVCVPGLMHRKCQSAYKCSGALQNGKKNRWERFKYLQTLFVQFECISTQTLHTHTHSDPGSTASEGKLYVCAFSLCYLLCSLCILCSFCHLFPFVSCSVSFVACVIAIFASPWRNQIVIPSFSFLTSISSEMSEETIATDWKVIDFPKPHFDFEKKITTQKNWTFANSSKHFVCAVCMLGIF